MQRFETSHVYPSPPPPVSTGKRKHAHGTPALRDLQALQRETNMEYEEECDATYTSSDITQVGEGGGGVFRWW